MKSFTFLQSPIKGRETDHRRVGTTRPTKEAGSRDKATVLMRRREIDADAYDRLIHHHGPPSSTQQLRESLGSS